MSTFWKAWVRNPALAGAIVAIASGAAGVPWSVALATAAILGFVAKAADWLYGHAVTRAARVESTATGEAPAPIPMRQRSRSTDRAA